MEPVIELSKLDPKWKLCGSRWYGDNTDESDFDYFTKNELSVELDLKSMGFKMKDNEYNDRNTNCVYEKENVHAILVKNESRRLVAREIARELSKSDRKQTAAWNAIYEAMRFMKHPTTIQP